MSPCEKKNGERENQTNTCDIVIVASLHLVQRTRYKDISLPIDDENQSLCILEIMSPKGADFVLPSDVPNLEKIRRAGKKLSRIIDIIKNDRVKGGSDSLMCLHVWTQNTV